MTDRLRDAARRHQTNIEAVKAAAERIRRELAEELATARAVPTVTAEPLPVSLLEETEEPS